MVETTTLKIQRNTKTSLDQYREHPNETYDQVIRKLVYIVKNVRAEPKLSRETIQKIEEARERMNQGEFLTEDELWKRLGLDVPHRIQQQGGRRITQSTTRNSGTSTKKTLRNKGTSSSVLHQTQRTK